MEIADAFLFATAGAVDPPDERWKRLAAPERRRRLRPRGLVQTRGSDKHWLGIHVGPPVNADCACGDRRMRRVQKAGDIDIVPAGVTGSWEDDADCRLLRLGLLPSLLREVAEELGRDPAEVELLPTLQLRDPRIEALGWAVKADLEAEVPSDPLYVDLLANALAVRLIEIASQGVPRPAPRRERGLSARQLRNVQDYIEASLDQRFHLADLALVAEVSVTRLKTLFHNSTGASVHQDVIRRRVERARVLLTKTSLPASEIALAAGFAHQSHIATTMRRVLGQTPRDIVRDAKEAGPILQEAVRT